ncbi:MAG: hypothetical protein QME94_09400 [Anaerolineae bacterium]|nr:hypothetical protein [Anaerolineae bacterium]
MRSVTGGRVVLGTLLILAGFLLAWQFVASAFRWSNGWMEGLSYVMGAVLFPAIAALIASGRCRHQATYWCAALVLAIPGAWCMRWAVWLLTRAPEIGPCPAYLPLSFAVAGLLFLVVAGMLAQRAYRHGR